MYFYSNMQKKNVIQPLFYNICFLNSYIAPTKCIRKKIMIFFLEIKKKLTKNAILLRKYAKFKQDLYANRVPTKVYKIN